ncbi:MAG: hypothetical protein R3D58_20035 [Saprospiraceae bacterium]
MDIVIDYDETTGLPLLKEQDKILNLIRQIREYLPLPYTIAEYGCGDKCSIILRKLMMLGIPLYALKRGMIMEKDMSEKALRERDFRKRPYALVSDNPLYRVKDFYDPTLFKMIEDKCAAVQIQEGAISTGPFLLHHDREVQYVEARSHIFVIIKFWQESEQTDVELILDPTINQEHLIEIEELRDYLNDDEALIFTAPLLGRFRLAHRYLTFLQRRQLASSQWSTETELAPKAHHAKLVRLLNGAAPASIGDPNHWTYANNIPNKDAQTHERQQKLTGKGDVLNEPLDKMLQARASHLGDVLLFRKELQSHVAGLKLGNILKADARQAEERLAPLAEIELIIAYYRAIRQVERWLRLGIPLNRLLPRQRQLNKVVGISMRLRRRIEKMAVVSQDANEEIDARTLNERFFAATLEVIEQMNTAGMAVFVDKVGNIHGLYSHNGLPDDRISTPAYIKQCTAKAICHCSHIDTVKDAGKYDGRLGVMAGIEIAHILADLKKYFNYIPTDARADSMLMVSAFIGEEMTFTGEDVSMPGSAAVAGLAAPDRIYRMKNSDGENFGVRLTAMLNFLKKHQAAGAITLVNDFEPASGSVELLEKCFDPELFYTPHTYERHIEQGPVLDRSGVPLVIVDAIMGIHQQDFFLNGENAESGALALNHRLRNLAKKERFRDLRVTVGVIEGAPDSRVSRKLDVAIRVRLKGERNHAGATLLEDRKDPGVAIARLAGHFVALVEKINAARKTKLKVVIGEIALLPGTNRNVIPEEAVATFGVQGNLPEARQHFLLQQIQAWVYGTLSGTVTEGGEGVELISIHPIDFISYYRSTRVSLDLRGAEEHTMQAFLEEARKELNSLAKALQLQTESTVEQQLQPYALSNSGQVLQIERSYGGSHNPNELLIGNDLLIGSLLQLEATLRFFNSTNAEPGPLFDLVKTCTPKEWREKLDRFISGALHDTCNIAAKKE